MFIGFKNNCLYLIFNIIFCIKIIIFLFVIKVVGEDDYSDYVDSYRDEYD